MSLYCSENTSTVIGRAGSPGEDNHLDRVQKVGVRSAVPSGVWLIIGLLVCCQVLVCLEALGRSLCGLVDFRSFYATGTIILRGAGSRIYDLGYQDVVQDEVVGKRFGALPFLYPPFAALPFVFLSLLPYKAAFVVWSCINVWLLWLSGKIIQSCRSRLRVGSRLFLVGCFACLFGTAVALMQGQISFLLLVIYCGSQALIRNEKPFAAGMVLALALAKFQIIIPIIVLFVLWRKWRVVLGFGAGALSLLALSLAMVGPRGLGGYLRYMTGIATDTLVRASEARIRYGMFPTSMPNLHGLTFGISGGAMWGHGLNLALCLVVMIFAARQRASLSVALPAAMLVSYHMQPHDLVLLLLPVSFVLDEVFGRRAARLDRRKTAQAIWACLMIMGLIILVLPVAGMLLSSGLNYVVSSSVAIILIVVSKLQRCRVSDEPSTTACMKAYVLGPGYGDDGLGG